MKTLLPRILRKLNLKKKRFLKSDLKLRTKIFITVVLLNLSLVIYSVSLLVLMKKNSPVKEEEEEAAEVVVEVSVEEIEVAKEEASEKTEEAMVVIEVAAEVVKEKNSLTTNQLSQLFEEIIIG